MLPHYRSIEAARDNLSGIIRCQNNYLALSAKAFWLMRAGDIKSSESFDYFVWFLSRNNHLIIYAMLLLPIVYMIFGLTQALPDAVHT